MVMDATQPQQPSPQSVGREFVRQYYTLLNKAPNHLHRFYNNNSSFIHGESALVVGQKNIHNHIQQLNFHDCHAKISQVDAQATLGNGVVVQVTGELSNDGQPMRRFTQTFVLAAQSPKKYYVHNDIFRYQDLYGDEEIDGEARSENADIEDHDQPTQTIGSNNEPQQPPQMVSGAIITTQEQQQHPAQVVAAASVAPAGPAVLTPHQAQLAGGAPQQQQTIYYSMPAAMLAAGANAPLAAQLAATGGGVVVPQQQVTQLNGVVAHDDLISTGMQPANPQQSLVTAVVQQQQPLATTTVPVGVATVPVPNASAITGFQQTPLIQQQLLQQQQPPQPTPQQPHLINQQNQTQQSLPSQVQKANTDIDDNISANTVSITSNTEPSSRTASATPVAVEPTPAPVVAAPQAVVDDFKTINEQQQQEKYEAVKQQQSEPKTYANLFKSTSSSPSGFVNAAMQQQQQLQQQSSNAGYQSSTTISTTTFSQTNTTSSMSVYNNRSNDNNTMRMDNNNVGASAAQVGGGSGGPLPQRNNSKFSKDFDQRRTSNPQYGDNHQLFLGNIPHHASEDELKALFGRFGVVMELRILSKPGNKLPPGVRNPLNYAFITYEESESVQNCLANCPVYFPENSPDGQKLNVEEKKPRIRSNDMPPRSSMDRNNMMNNNMGNTQRNSMSNSGGPPSRSLSNSGSSNNMMRGNSNSNMSRGGSTGAGPRIGGAFNRNENRSGGPSNGGGPQVRGGGGGNNSQSSGGGGNYGGRR